MTRTLPQIQTQEVARILAITPARVSQLVKEGKLKIAVKLQDGTPLFERKEVEQLKQARIAELLQKVQTLRST